MRDGLYRVETRTFCAGFVLRDNQVIRCAPILHRRFAHWVTLAVWIAE